MIHNDLLTSSNLGGATALPLNAFDNMFGSIVASALGFTAILLFIFLLYGGFKYITSGGDPKNLEVAKKTVSYALIGFVLAASAVLILVIIEEITGQTGWRNFSVVGQP